MDRGSGARPVGDPDAPGGKTLRVHRPADGSCIGEFPVATGPEVRQAVERARRAQPPWAERGARERAAVLRGLADEVGRRPDEIAAVVVSETGKPRIEALAEVLLTVDLLRYWARAAPGQLRRRRVGTGWLVGKGAYVYREPYGVIGAITPWNYPFLLAMDAVTAALFAGNAVVLKPSELTPFSGVGIGELCRDAGVPGGLVQVVVGDGSTGEALVRAGVDKVVFTGSSGTGRAVMAAAAESLTPVALELGGKDPAIVLEDADLDRAADGIVYGAFFNAGQTCISTERVFVVDEVHDAFVERVAARAARLRVGAGEDVDVGPMISPAQISVVEEQVADARARGARVVVGGERLAEGSPCYRPTVLVDVDPAMKVMREETFGPVLPIVRVGGEDDAVRLVGESSYGLFASVWTGDRERGMRLGARLRTGGVSINDTLSHYAVPGLPMGGVGESGFGRRRGSAGLEEMTRPRSVLVHRVGLRRELWWYPYSEGALGVVRALLEYRGTTGLRGLWRGLRRLLSGRGGAP